MKAILIRGQGPVETSRIAPEEVPDPSPAPGSLLLKVSACGVCHTDLHIAEGDLPLVKSPVIPGHQIVGTIAAAGAGPAGTGGAGNPQPSGAPRPPSGNAWSIGERVGVPWVSATCGRCSYCLTDRENLCDAIRFTGYHIDGGFAEYAVVPEASVCRLPGNFSDQAAAPLLCAGIVGYRAVKLSGIGSGMRLGIVGFGASAHLNIQVARYLGADVFVFSRDAGHRRHAEELGAVWTGTLEMVPPHLLDAVVSFAPAGEIVPRCLALLRKGGRLLLAGVFLTPVAQFEYGLLYHERSVASVANSTRTDAVEFLELAGKIPVKTEVTLFRLGEAQQALLAVKKSRLRGAAVLMIA
jgi:propanol-preferring alcohol dehydrogenase